MMEKPSTTDLLLAAIRKNQRGSYREWMDATGISSSAVIRHHLHKLERAGKVRLHPGQPRSVELLPEGGAGYSRDTVETAIEVLHAFAAGDLPLPDDVAVELVDAAFDVISMPGVTRITCEIGEGPAVSA